MCQSLRTQMMAGSFQFFRCHLYANCKNVDCTDSSENCAECERTEEVSHFAASRLAATFLANVFLGKVYRLNERTETRCKKFRMCATLGGGERRPVKKVSAELQTMVPANQIELNGIHLHKSWMASFLICKWWYQSLPNIGYWLIIGCSLFFSKLVFPGYPSTWCSECQKEC